MGSVPKRLTGTCISHPLMTSSRDAEMAVPGCGQPATRAEQRRCKAPQSCAVSSRLPVCRSRLCGPGRASRVGARLAVDRNCNGILSQTRGSSHQSLRCRLQGCTLGSEEFHFKGGHPTTALLGPDRLHRGSRTRQVGDRKVGKHTGTDAARYSHRAHFLWPLRSEEGTDDRCGNSSRLVRYLIRLREQTVDDGLTTRRPCDFAVLLNLLSH